MHGLKTPLFGLRTSSRPASPAPTTRISPPHVPPLVPTGAITPLDLSTPASPIEGPKDIPPRRPLAKLHLPSAFRRASPSPSPAPIPASTTATATTGSNYLDALALRGQDLLRASLRALHRPLNVLLTNVSTLLAPLVLATPSNVLSGNGWLSLGASQAHALSLATLVAELLESLDALPGDCAKVGGEGLRSIKQGLEGVISRVVQPVLTAVRTELCTLVDALELGPLAGGKKDNSLAGPITVATKILARVGNVPGPVAGGAIAACEIAIVWRAMVALSHRKIDPNPKSLSTKSSGPLKSATPLLPKRMTPPNTPPPARFLLPTSRPPSPPSAPSQAMQLANDARVVLAMLDGMPRPSGEDAKEAVGEAFGALARFVEVLGMLASPMFDKAALIKLVDGETSLPAKSPSPSSTSKSPSPAKSSPTQPSSPSSDEDEELPALLVLPTLLYGRSVASILGIDEAAYRERCLSGFGRAEASEEVVLRAVLARLDEEERVPEWVKDWIKTRAQE
ncbi:hypothetical protein OPQ81_005134 [Rhizoctonia solani]|nr:hypothetical protein OPQ81_005134 [Rhizoctonia solani]